MLIVQEYLLNHSLKDLEKEHGVYAKLSKDAHKFSLSYDQIEAKESSLLVQECRGLILGSKLGKKFDVNLAIGQTDVIAFPMRRFFNMGQSQVTFDFEDQNLQIFEKLDGTLSILYFDHYLNEWHIATRGVPEADLPLNGLELTFRTLFEKALKETTSLSFIDFTNQLNKNLTYCFELTTPYNQIVVLYPHSKITLLAARDLSSEDMSEVDISKANVPLVPLVAKHNLPKNINEIISFVTSRSGKDFEGVVLLDSYFNRVKIKDPGYCFFSKSKDNLFASPRNRLEIVILDKADDLFPILSDEIKEELISLKEKYKNFIILHDKEFNELKNKYQTKKEFAIAISKRTDVWSAPLFQMFDKKVNSMQDFVKTNLNNDGLGYNSSFLDKLGSFL